MDIAELTVVLEAGDDLMAVTRTLGLDCLPREAEAEHERYLADLSDAISELRVMVAAESLKMWKADGTFRAGPSRELRARLMRVRSAPARTVLTVLEGICYGAAGAFFANASSVVRIDRGSIMPLPERWLPDVQTPGTPPNPITVHPTLLDRRCNFVLWDHEWELELDYTFRDRLDLVCAVRMPCEDKRDADGTITRLAYELPKIATVHPFHGSTEMTTDTAVQEEVGRGWFFGVHPVLPEHDPDNEGERQRFIEASHRKVLDALAKAGGCAPIAVLPEFCLHSPDGLDQLIADSDDDLPALVVAGSAHTGADDRPQRANTSHVFLDRYPILKISKYQPFVARISSSDYYEDIASRPRVLRVAAGTATRLAIAICADVNSPNVINAMTWAGVNLVLSPSWTPRIGAASGALGTLATYCQCVSVVANTPYHWMADGGEEPLWACSVVPRETDREGYHRSDGLPPAVGLLDPNCVPADQENYWTWVT